MSSNISRENNGGINPSPVTTHFCHQKYLDVKSTDKAPRCVNAWIYFCVGLLSVFGSHVMDFSIITVCLTRADGLIVSTPTARRA